MQFRSPDQARAATALDDSLVDGELKLVAKLSDPHRKDKRKGAIYEGREVYVSNVDWAASEDDVKEVFEKYGPVEKVRVPRGKEGKSKGMAFVVFEAKVSLPRVLRLVLLSHPLRDHCGPWFPYVLLADLSIGECRVVPGAGQDQVQVKAAAR